MSIGNSVTDPALSHECDQAAELDRLRALNMELLRQLKRAESLLWDALGGNDDKYNASRANRMLRSIRAAIAKAQS